MNGIGRILIIALISIANVQAMRNLRIGDTIKLSKKYSIEVIVGDIFNGFDGSRFIEKKYDTEHEYEMFYQTCMFFESLKEYFYPQVFIDKKLKTNASSRLFYHMDLWRDEYLGVNKNYVDNRHFRYGIVKLCKTIEDQSLNIKLMDDEYFLEVANDGNYSIWMNETVLFRLKRDDETHYVSSVSTGTCLLQISINDAIKCMNYNPKSPDDAAEFFKTSIHQSSITTVDVNRQLENTINEYYFLNNLHYSLFKFPLIEFYHQNNILSKFENRNIVSLVLRTLPELQATSGFNREYVLSLTNLIKRDDITPGIALNLEELVDSRSGLVTIKDFVMNTNDEVIPASRTYSFSNCRKLIENDAPELENGKLDVFEKMLKRQNYGTDPKNLIEERTCLKLTICSKLRKQKLLFPLMTVIKLNENSKNNVKYNIIERKNMMLWFSKSDETHFVLSTVKGDCLSQTLIYDYGVDIYEDRSMFDYDPIFKGEILSATSNHTLEERVKNFVDNDLRNAMRNGTNLVSFLTTYEELERNNVVSKALIHLYLEELI